MAIRNDQQCLARFDAVCLGYDRQPVLRDLCFELAAGDYVGIVGPNGAGKTTLLRALLGTLRPLSGQITLPRGRLRFGYVPQLQTVDEVFPLTVLEVVLMGRRGQLGPLRRPGRRDREQAWRGLEEVGIADQAGRLYRELSGGQKQRTLMARALANEPHLLVLDEPTNDMDLAGEKATMALVDRLQAHRGMAVVMVSHYLNVMLNHAHRIGLLGNGKLTLTPVEELLAAGYLERLYGVPARIGNINGAWVVV